MPINPNIALAVRGPEVQIPNVLAQAVQIEQLREAQATAEERNKLRALDPAAADYESQLFRVNPQLGISYRKERTASEASEATRQKALTEAASARQKMLGQAMRDISARPSDANITAHLEDVLESSLYSPEEKASVQKRSQMLLGMPFEERKMFLIQQGATSGELKPSVQQINRLGQTDVLQVPAFGGKPTTVGTFADVPLPPEVAQQKKEIAQASRPITNITNVQEKAEAGARGQMLVDQYKDISKAAGLAIKTLPAIEANLGALNKGLDTGFGTDAKKAGARILGALGVQDAEKFAADAEMFQSNAINAVLQKQLEQKGPQTESDARRIEQVGAELGKTKAANEFILSMAKEQLRRDVEQRNFYDRWYKNNKTYDGAEDAWFAGEGGKSLFDRPALKKYAPGVAAGGAAVQQIPGQRPAPAAAPAVAPNIDALLNKYR